MLQPFLRKYDVSGSYFQIKQETSQILVVTKIWDFCVA